VWTGRREARGLASALAGEISSVIGIVRRRDYRGSIQALIKAVGTSHQPQAVRFPAIQDRFAVYEANLAKLVTLPGNLPQAVVSFYTHAKSFNDEMSPDHPQPATEAEAIQRLKQLDELIVALLALGDGAVLALEGNRKRLDAQVNSTPCVSLESKSPEAQPPTTFHKGVAAVGTGELSNFTPRAQQVLALSRREADHLNHNFVGTEHLLLGLIALGQGTAVTVLEQMGLNLETVRLEVKKQVGVGPEPRHLGNIPYTPRVKKVLALAAREAKSLNHTYVGTEHILLGLLREGDGVGARVLRQLGVEAEDTRQRILKELDPNFDPGDRGRQGEPEG